MKLIKAKPTRNVAIFYILAGHGIQMSGKQFVLLNEFNKETGFYFMWGIEEMMRFLAESFSNSYHVGIFACCREIYNPTRHSGCLGGDQKEIDKIFREKYPPTNTTDGLEASTSLDTFK